MTNYIDTQVKESILDDMVELYTRANILAHNKIKEYGEEHKNYNTFSLEDI